MNASELDATYGIGSEHIMACAAAAAGYGIALSTFAPPFVAASGACLALAMLLIAVIDARRFIIPDVLSLPLVPLGIAVSALLSREAVEYAVLERTAAAVVAGATLLAVRWFYRRLRNVEGLGLGDVKLFAAAGAWVGLGALGMTLLLASCAALVTVLLRHGVRNPASLGPRTPIPFGSFIAPSILIMWSASLWPS